MDEAQQGMYVEASSAIKDQPSSSFEVLCERLMAISALNKSVGSQNAVAANAVLAVWSGPRGAAAAANAVITAVEERWVGGLIVEMHADLFPFGREMPAEVLNLLSAAIQNRLILQQNMVYQDLACPHLANIHFFISKIQ